MNDAGNHSVNHQPPLIHGQTQVFVPLLGCQANGIGQSGSGTTITHPGSPREAKKRWDSVDEDELYEE
jgi:hypothetical protein